MDPFEQLPPPPAPAPAPAPARPRWRLGLILFLVATILGGFAGAQIATERNDDSASLEIAPESSPTDDEPAPSSDLDVEPSDQPVQTAPPGDDVEGALDVGAIVDRIGPDRKSTRLNSSHYSPSRMPSSA